MKDIIDRLRAAMVGMAYPLIQRDVITLLDMVDGARTDLDERARVLDWIEHNLREARRGSKEAQILTTLRKQVEEGGYPKQRGMRI